MITIDAVGSISTCHNKVMWEDSRHSMISYPQGKYIIVWFVISFGRLKELYDRPVDIEPTG
jgi:hypothetical protein